MVVEVIPSDAECQLDMQNDGRNVVWYGMCAVGSVMCNLYLNVAMCMVWCEVGM